MLVASPLDSIDVLSTRSLSLLSFFHKMNNSPKAIICKTHGFGTKNLLNVFAASSLIYITIGSCDSQADSGQVLFILVALSYFFYVFNELINVTYIERDDESLFVKPINRLTFKKNHEFTIGDILRIMKDVSVYTYKGIPYRTYKVVVNTKDGKSISILTARNEEEADRLVRLVKNGIGI